ncbi:MAG: hypothetical protein M3Y06_03405 [Actinomycetota bacterium]|nr:hypothetical protein [Actinomycetota bacterium]
MKAFALVTALLATGCGFGAPSGLSAGDASDDGTTQDDDGVVIIRDAPGDPVDAATVDATLDGPPPETCTGSPDHDGDGLRDDCDLCPHLPSAALPQPDGDGDGVGDACDPRPAIAGDHRVAFFGFYDGDSLAAFNQYNVSWTIIGGRVMPTTLSSKIAILALPDDMARAYAVTSVAYTSLRGDLKSEVGIDAAFHVTNQAIDRYSSCNLVAGGGGIDARASASWPGGRDSVKAAWTDTNVSLRIAIDQQQSGGQEQVQCTLTPEAGPVAAPVCDESTTTTGRVALYADNGALASFDYLFVVSRGGP